MLRPKTAQENIEVVDANGQSLAYVYSRETPDAAHLAKVLTEDEAHPLLHDPPQLARPKVRKLPGFRQKLLGRHPSVAILLRGK
jgi:hypothetical protein